MTPPSANNSEKVSGVGVARVLHFVAVLPAEMVAADRVCSSGQTDALEGERPHLVMGRPTAAGPPSCAGSYDRRAVGGVEAAGIGPRTVGRLVSSGVAKLGAARSDGVQGPPPSWGRPCWQTQGRKQHPRAI